MLQSCHPPHQGFARKCSSSGQKTRLSSWSIRTNSLIVSLVAALTNRKGCSYSWTKANLRAWTQSLISVVFEVVFLFRLFELYTTLNVPDDCFLLTSRRESLPISAEPD